MPAISSTRLLIGQFVAQMGHSIHTVRWYEAQGLLPRVTRDGGGGAFIANAMSAGSR